MMRAFAAVLPLSFLLVATATAQTEPAAEQPPPSEKIMNLGICSGAFSAFEVLSKQMPQSEKRDEAVKGVAMLNTKLGEAISADERADFDRVRMGAGNAMLQPFHKEAAAGEEDQKKAMAAIAATVQECQQGLFTETPSDKPPAG